MLQNGIKSNVVFPDNTVLFSKDIGVNLQLNSIAPMVKISDFAAANNIALGVDIFSPDKKPQAVEKDIIDIFGHNNTSIRIHKSKTRKISIATRDVNATAK